MKGVRNTNHNFDVDVAVKYGVNAAVILNNIYFWVQKNEANNHNFFDGCYWTYNSRKAFMKIFPYLSERQIKMALDKLIDDGVIKTGCYNKEAWDRTLWYALTEKGACIMQKCQMQDAEMSNANSENVRPIPDINTDINADRKPDISISCEYPGFDDFWKVYPRHVAKQNAQRSWKSLKPNDELVKRIVADVNRRLESEWRGKDMQYIPHPSTYLNQRRWEDETEVKKVAEHREPDPVILTDEEQRIIDEIYANGGGWG